MYFIKITTSYDPKNSLQKYLVSELNRLECLTVEQPDELKQHLERLVFRANLCYKRCSPTTAYMRATERGSYTAWVSGIMQLSLYEQQGAFNSTELLRPHASRDATTQTALFATEQQ